MNQDPLTGADILKPCGKGALMSEKEEHIRLTQLTSKGG